MAPLEDIVHEAQTMKVGQQLLLYCSVLTLCTAAALFKHRNSSQHGSSSVKVEGKRSDQRGAAVCRRACVQTLGIWACLRCTSVMSTSLVFTKDSQCLPGQQWWLLSELPPT